MNYIDYMDQGGLTSYPYYSKRVLQTPLLNRLGIQLKYPPILYGINFSKMANDAIQTKDVDVENSTVASDGIKFNVQPVVSSTYTTPKFSYIQPVPKLASITDGGVYTFTNNQPRS